MSPLEDWRRHQLAVERATELGIRVPEVDGSRDAEGAAEHFNPFLARVP